MGAYDSFRTKYHFPGISFASSDVLRYIIGPKGKSGLLWDYGLDTVTTLFAGGTTTPKMAVGIVGTAAAYATAYDFGLAAVAGGSVSIRTKYREGIDASFLTYMPVATRSIAADTVVMVTFSAATGGGAAGVADGFVEIIWQD